MTPLRVNNSARIIGTEDLTVPYDIEYSTAKTGPLFQSEEICYILVFKSHLRTGCWLQKLLTENL